MFIWDLGTCLLKMANKLWQGNPFLLTMNFVVANISWGLRKQTPGVRVCFCLGKCFGSFLKNMWHAPCLFPVICAVFKQAKSTLINYIRLCFGIWFPFMQCLRILVGVFCLKLASHTFLVDVDNCARVKDTPSFGLGPYSHFWSTHLSPLLHYQDFAFNIPQLNRPHSHLLLVHQQYEFTPFLLALSSLICVGHHDNMLVEQCENLKQPLDHTSSSSRWMVLALL